MSTGVHQGSLVKSQLLYQLSYAGAPVIVFAESSAACRRSHGRPRALLSNCCQTGGADGVVEGSRKAFSSCSERQAAPFGTTSRHATLADVRRPLDYTKTH